MGSGFKDFASGDILTAGDVDNYLMRQTVMTFASASARNTALSGVLDEGMVAYLEDTNVLTVYNGSSWFQYGPGKILQIVRATDSTDRTTTSTSFVDANLSVTITPTSTSSDLLFLVSYRAASATAGAYLQITDSSNVAVNGSDFLVTQDLSGSAKVEQLTGFAFASPASTSALTYKTRFRSGTGGSITMENASNPAQLIVMEVSA